MKKIVDANRQILYLSMVWPLTLDELMDLEEQQAQVDFNAAFQQQLVQLTAWEDLGDNPEFDMPILPFYQDNSVGAVKRKQDKRRDCVWTSRKWCYQ